MEKMTTNEFEFKLEHSCQHCCDIKEENRRLREVLLHISEERFCTPHTKVKIFSALNPDK